MFGLDVQRLDCLDYLCIEIRGSVKDQELRRGIAGECFPQLLHNPGTGRMPSNFQMQDVPPGMRNDEEAVQRTKRQRRHSNEVHRRNGILMIAQNAKFSKRRSR